MYVHYNRTLRDRTKGAYVTTLHAINSGIIKLSKQTKACTVYRGVAGGVLPDQFWTPNDHGVMGGIELGFMSTTTNREVALTYMRQSGKVAKMVFEMRMGMIDRGAVRIEFSNAQIAALGRVNPSPPPHTAPSPVHRTCRYSPSSLRRRRSCSRRSRALRWHQCRASRATLLWRSCASRATCTT